MWTDLGFDWVPARGLEYTVLVQRSDDGVLRALVSADGEVDVEVSIREARGYVFDNSTLPTAIIEHIEKVLEREVE